MKITIEDLSQHEACRPGLKYALRHFPDGFTFEEAAASPLVGYNFLLWLAQNMPHAVSVEALCSSPYEGLKLEAERRADCPADWLAERRAERERIAEQTAIEFEIWRKFEP